MTHKTESFVLADPRDFDGDPYEVAERAVAQLEGVLRVFEATVPATILMVRNAELERQIATGTDPSVPAYDESTQGRKWAALREQIDGLRKELALLRRVAAYNPRAPVKG